MKMKTDVVLVEKGKGNDAEQLLLKNNFKVVTNMRFRFDLNTAVVIFVGTAILFLLLIYVF